MTKGMMTSPALPKGGRQCRAFSLVEVMVGLTLFAVAIVSVMVALRQGRKMLVEPENKGLAWSRAQSVLEKALAMSYAGLVDVSTGKTTLTVPKDCTVNVAQTHMDKGTGISSDIPYCSIKVDCGYTEDNVTKTVSLSGIVPFPYMQIYSQPRDPLTEHVTVTAAYSGAPPGTNVMTIKFTPLVKSNLMIFYDLAIDVTNVTPATATNQLKPTDLLITRAYFNNTAVGIPTGTPIMTQPTIGNVVGVAASAVNPGVENIATVNWYKDTANGIITLKKANIIVLRTENNK